jgi:hypothetical protein
MSNEAIVNALLAKENVGHPMDSIDTFADELSAVTAERLMPDARLCAAGRSALAVVGDDALARAAIKQVWP